MPKNTTNNEINAIANPNLLVNPSQNANNKKIVTKGKVDNVVKGVMARVHNTKTTKTPNVNIKTIKVIDSIGQTTQANPRPSVKINNNTDESKTVLNKPLSVRSSSITSQNKIGKIYFNPICRGNYNQFS